jgi:GntR family transcriptional regulator
VEQVRSALLQRIGAGEYKQLGNRLPSEALLSEEYGVSRATIRDALKSLELEGIVIRRQGIGTFVDASVAETALRIQPFENTSFLQLIQRSHNTATHRLLRSDIEPAGALAQALQVPESTLCLSMEKLFCSNDTPVIHCWNVVPLSLALPNYLPELAVGYACHESVYTFLRTKCNRVVDYHDSRVQARACDANVAAALAYAAGQPIMQLEEVGYSKHKAPLFFGLSYFRSDLVSFRFRRGLTVDL